MLTLTSLTMSLWWEQAGSGESSFADWGETGFAGSSGSGCIGCGESGFAESLNRCITYSLWRNDRSIKYPMVVMGMLVMVMVVMVIVVEVMIDKRGLIECMQYEKYASFCNSTLHNVTLTHYFHHTFPIDKVHNRLSYSIVSIRNKLLTEILYLRYSCMEAFHHAIAITQLWVTYCYYIIPICRCRPPTLCKPVQQKRKNGKHRGHELSYVQNYVKPYVPLLIGNDVGDLSADLMHG